MYTTKFPRIITVACQKGGSCKTTTSFNLGAGLARKGHRVLLVDMDPQGDLTLCCGHNPDHLTTNMFEVMARGMALPEILRTSGIGCDIAPSSLGLQTLDMEMSTNNHRVYLLRDALMSLSAAYDFIVIDTPPSMNLLTYNALQASGEVVVPMLCEPFSLRGMGRLLRIIREFQHPARNPILQLSAVVPCRYDKRKRLTQQALDMIEGLIPSGTPVCIIRDNIAVSEASGLQRDIYTYAPTSNGAEDYDALTQVMMQQHEAKVARILNAYTHRRDPSNSGQMTQYLAG